MSFLNKEGLERLWQHIVTRLGEKADKTEIEELKELPIVKGDRENSLEIAAGGIILSEGSIAGGQDEDGSLAIAGCKGFFYLYHSDTDVYLSLAQGTEEWSDEAQALLNSWQGKKINIVGSHKHTMCSQVIAIMGNCIAVDKLPFGEQIPFDTTAPNTYEAVDWNTLTNPDWDDGAVYCPEAPEAGMVPFGRGARSIGANTQAIGTYSVAEGKQTLAANDFGHAEGRWTKAGYASHAEGYNTSAIGQGAHSEGHDTVASAHSSHAEGKGTTASGNASHAEGQTNTVSGAASHVEGLSNQVHGGDSHGEGFGNTVSSTASHSHAEGARNTVSSNSAHAEGDGNTVSGRGAHAEGIGNTASGESAHVEGNGNTASNKNTHAEGLGNTASGEGAHVEGSNVQATGNYSHGEGLNGKAIGVGSHKEGANGEASGNYSHVEGLSCKTVSGASGAHAEGEATEAKGQYSHSEGWHTIANGRSNHAQGEYNVANPDVSSSNPRGKYAHIVGNGSSDGARSNAHTVDWNGNAWFAGDVSVGANSKKLATEEFVNEKVASAGGTSNCPIKKGSGENTAILGTASEASASGRNGATIGGASFKSTSSTYYKSITLNGNVATYTGTASTTYWKVGEKVVFTNSYSSTSNGGPYSPLGEGTITAIDTTAKTFTFDVTPPTGTTYVMLAAGNKNTHINSTVIGSGLTSVGNDSLVVGKNNTTRSSGLFVVGDGMYNSSKSNAFEIYKSSDISTYSYGLIKSGMYVGSANSNNLVQTAASVTNKIQEQVPSIVSPLLSNKMDKIITVNKLASGGDFNNISITYNSVEGAKKQYKI